MGAMPNMPAPVHFEARSPMRRPHWRLCRALELLRRRRRPIWPGRADDHPIRAYRLLLLGLTNAGEDIEEQENVIREYPDVCQAHFFYYTPDFTTRQEIEARLLTQESYAEIGRRFATTPKTIEYYEQIFFNVRDRLKLSSWVSKIIRNGLRDEQQWGCSLATAQRGYTLRLFGYAGGPLALDAILNTPMNSSGRAGDLKAWCKDTLESFIMSAAAAAVINLELTQKNMLQLIKLALRDSKPNRTPEQKAADEEFDSRFAKFGETLRRATQPDAKPEDLYEPYKR
jgi:hypothetical protein